MDNMKVSKRPGQANSLGEGRKDEAVWDLIGGLSPREKELVSLFRACDEEHRGLIFELAELSSKAPELKRRMGEERVKQIYKELEDSASEL